MSKTLIIRKSFHIPVKLYFLVEKRSSNNSSIKINKLSTQYLLNEKFKYRDFQNGSFFWLDVDILQRTPIDKSAILVDDKCKKKKVFKIKGGFLFRILY